MSPKYADMLLTKSWQTPNALDEGSISNDVAKTLRDNVAMMELDIEDQLE